VLAVAVALPPAPGRFTVADLTAKVRAMTGGTGHTTRQGRPRLRGKYLVDKPGRTRRHLSPRGDPGRGCLLTLREKAIAPLVAGARDDLDHTPTTCTRTDRDDRRMSESRRDGVVRHRITRRLALPERAVATDTGFWICNGVGNQSRAPN
jgi:hypothetical protein